MKIFTALLCGLLFGAGLALAGMTDPAKVLGFLDLAGTWNPSLAFVMGAGLLITTPAFYLARRRNAQPLVDSRFYLSTQSQIEPRLIGGSVLFGIGWGLSGLCPGPALANIGTGIGPVLVFLACMVAGMWLQEQFETLRQSRALQPRTAGST